MSPAYEIRAMLNEVKMSENKMPQSEPELEHECGASHPGGFLAGLLLGGLAGAVAMLLLAPHTGKRTRADIQHKSTELRDQATETVEDAVDQVRAKAHHIKASVRKEAKGLEHRGQEMLDEKVERVSAAVADLKTAMQRS
jgi:gas vesicle protein